MNLILIFFFILMNSFCFARINFIHIPKCGGISMHNLLIKNFKYGQSYPRNAIVKPFYYINNFQELLDHIEEYPRIEHELVWGHFPFWFFEQKDPSFQSSFFFTILRDPIERVLSQYRYDKQEATNLGNDLKDSYTPLSVPENVMCKFLCSDPTKREEELLKEAKNNLERMDFIIFLDDFDNGVKSLFKMLNLKLSDSIPILNATNEETYDQVILDKVREKNDLDVQLYEYALEHFRYHRSMQN